NGEAIEAADTALTKDTSKEVRFLAARVFAEAGALDKAQALGAALSSELPLEPRALGKNIEGLVLLKSGKAGQAVDKLQEANKLIDTWFGHFDLGRAFLEADGLPQADSEFDRCITNRNEALALMNEQPTYGYLPLAHYYQGKVREGLHNTKFADSYREYLRIRGNSTEDPLVPQI